MASSPEDDVRSDQGLVPGPETAPETAGGSSPEVQPAPPPRPRRRWPLVAAAVCLVGAGAAAALLVAATGSDDAATGSEPVTIRAVTAEQRDLIEYTDLDGTFGYADTRSIASSSPGTITDIVDDGTVIDRGSTIYEVDARPVTAMFGDIPMYRDLTEGDEGDDVLALEANLASLGYHIDEPDDDGDEVDTGFTVDGVYDAATADAVDRWQADLGLDETGTVSAADIIVIGGPAIASGITVAVGDPVQPGSPVLDLNVTGTVRTFHADRAGELELLAPGGPVRSGQVLFSVDDLPVTAIVTDETFDRELSVGIADGEDVRVLEEMLVALGYDARGDLVPDDEFDEVTAEAVEDWEDDLADDSDEVVVDGVVDLDQLVIVEPETTIGSVTERDGDLVAGGSELFQWRTEAGTRVVTTAIDVADQQKLAAGDTVDVVFPDGTTVVGTVATVATSSTTDPTDPNAEPTLAVEIALDALPASADGLNELDVDVRLIDELVAGATVVPASALVATADGGYAVEVVDGTTTSFVGVEPGMFVDGFVEVVGIEAGVPVVVPS
ncbi:MAG: peptidoglycan-binding protein [Actinomycetota bacterium]